MAQEITGWTEPPTWQAPPPLRPNPRSEWNEVAEQDDRHICPHCGEPMRAHDRCRNCGRLVSSRVKKSWYDDEKNHGTYIPYIVTKNDQDQPNGYVMANPAEGHRSLIKQLAEAGITDTSKMIQGQVNDGMFQGEPYHEAANVGVPNDMHERIHAEAVERLRRHRDLYNTASINEPDSASDEMQQLLDAYRRQHDNFFGTE